MALKQLIGDFETASGTDLKKCGSQRYAECPTTEIFLFGYTIDNGPRKLWHPGDDETELRAHAADENITFIAFNVAFEKAIWREIMVKVYGFPDIPNSRWHDIMAVCAMKQLPQKFERALSALRLPYSKDTAGSAFTVALSKPNKKTGQLDRSPESLKKVDDYNITDLDGEQCLHERVGWLPPGERRVWLLDQRINERGVRLDLDYVSACLDVVSKASVPLMKEFADLTNGLKVTQRDKTIAWVRANGVEIPDMKKETLDAILGTDEGEADNDGEPDDFGDGPAPVDLPPRVHRALHIRQLIGSASIKKLGRMALCVSADGRARQLCQYHGAGPGRWAGRLFQPHNFPRGSLRIGDDAPDPEVVYQALMTRDPDYIEMILGKPPVECVVSGLRHAMIPDPDRTFVSGDFSTIELRVNLAIAGQMDKLKLLMTGEDPYCDMASLLFGRKITKKDMKERQFGKNAVLGLGFQMGAKKFRDKYAKDMTLEEVQQAVDTFRQVWAPEIPNNWYELEKAAMLTVWEKTPHEARGVEYRLEDGFLTARLPSGRKLWYFNPQPIRKAMPWDKTDIRRAWTYQATKKGQLTAIDAYGGLLTENVVQALARDLLVAAMFKAEQNGFPVVLTVHDELLTEPLKADADEKALDQIMRDRPEWAKQLQIPVATETWVGDRYRK